MECGWDFLPDLCDKNYSTIRNVAILEMFFLLCTNQIIGFNQYSRVDPAPYACISFFYSLVSVLRWFDSDYSRWPGEQIIGPTVYARP